MGQSKRMPLGCRTCRAAAEGGHLEVLQWALANGCQGDTDTCEAFGRERPSGGAAVGPRKRMPVE